MIDHIFQIIIYINIYVMNARYNYPNVAVYAVLLSVFKDFARVSTVGSYCHFRNTAEFKKILVTNKANK